MGRTNGQTDMLTVTRRSVSPSNKRSAGRSVGRLVGCACVTCVRARRDGRLVGRWEAWTDGRTGCRRECPTGGRVHGEWEKESNVRCVGRKRRVTCVSVG